MNEPKIIDAAIMEILEDVFHPDATFPGATLKDELQLSITLNPDLDKIAHAIKIYGQQLLNKAAHDVYNSRLLFDSNHKAITENVRDFILKVEL